MQQMNGDYREMEGDIWRKMEKRRGLTGGFGEGREEIRSEVVEFLIGIGTTPLVLHCHLKPIPKLQHHFYAFLQLLFMIYPFNSSIA